MIKLTYGQKQLIIFLLMLFGSLALLPNLVSKISKESPCSTNRQRPQSDAASEGEGDKHHNRHHRDNARPRSFICQGKSNGSTSLDSAAAQRIQLSYASRKVFVFENTIAFALDEELLLRECWSHIRINNQTIHRGAEE